MDPQKTTVLDIELFPMTVYTWQLKDQYIDNSQLIEDWSIAAWGAKQLGEPASKLVYMDQRNAKNPRNDVKILLPLWEMLDEAEIVITQNGEKFDVPKLNARFLMHGMKPPKPFKQIDTYKIVKKVAGFTSNKLEYLTEKLCTKYKKLSHGKFPGLTLWKECLAGNKEAWDEMKKYNINDVLSTEELYMKIRAWDERKSSPRIFVDNGVCPVCGSTNREKRGLDRNLTTVMQRYKCNDCNKWRSEKVPK